MADNINNNDNDDDGALLEVDRGRVVMDGVYLNGMHALLPVRLRSLSARLPLLVRLHASPSLNHQIAFQLSNENLPFHTTDTADTDTVNDTDLTINDTTVNHTTTDVVPTNTASAAARTHAANAPVQFNQLFNYVNHVSHVLLPPLHSRHIILAFLPDTPPSNTHHSSSSSSASTPNVAAAEFFNVDGSISFDVFYLDECSDSAATTTSPSSFSFSSSALHTSSSSLSLSMSSSSRPESAPLPLPLSLAMTAMTDATAARGDSESATTRSCNTTTSSSINYPPRKHLVTYHSAEDGSQVTGYINPVPDYVKTLKFKSRVCLSVLWTDVSVNGILFQDCVVGGAYFKDFAVWNRSEIDLFWRLNIPDLPPSDTAAILEFTDLDKNEPLDFYHPIPSFSYRRIRCTFKPQDVGDFHYDLQFENYNDSNNMELVHMHASVRSASQNEVLVVSSGAILDFGDCCAGMWTRQELVLRNVSTEHPLDIHFSVNNADVRFEFKTDHFELPHASSLDFDDTRNISTPWSERSFEEGPSNASQQDLSRALSAGSSRPISPSAVKKEESGDEERSVSSVEVADEWTSKTHRHDDIAVTKEADNVKEFTEFEDIFLKPQAEKTVEVCYRPVKSAHLQPNVAGKLSRREFKIHLSYFVPGNLNQITKVIQCRARSCVSLIEVTPQLLDFGETDVGTLKTLPITIRNLSELNAVVELRFSSKILNSFRGEITIPPMQSHQVRVEIYPRKINPEYRNQIIVTNLMNRDNDQTIEVVSNNIDKYRVTFHSLFYRIFTPSSMNFIDFGTVMLNSPVVRTFSMSNICDTPLKLEITSSLPEEIQMYTIAKDCLPVDSTASSTARREKILEAIGDRRMMKADSSGLSSSSSAANVISMSHSVKVKEDEGLSRMNTEYLDLADSLNMRLKDLKFSPRKSKQTKKVDQKDGQVSSSERVDSVLAVRDRGVPESAAPFGKNTSLGEPVPMDSTNLLAPQLATISDLSRLSLTELIKFAELVSQTNVNNISRSSVEEKFVKAVIAIRREIDVAISERRLVPISTVDLDSDTDITVIVIFKPSSKIRHYIDTKPKKLDAKLFFRLLELNRRCFDREWGSDAKELPVRELVVKSSLCRSVMEVGQRNINYGLIAKNERRLKTLVIHNRSEMPLYYAIRKSGLIASGDLVLTEGRIGIIRSYGKKEVDFIFNPSLPGTYQEHLVIENIQDRDNDQTVTVKAVIRKPSSFFIKHLDLDFGVCLVDDSALPIQKIHISNTTSQLKYFEIRYDAKELSFQDYNVDIGFELSPETTAYNGGEGFMPKEIEEQIEQLEQKLKIAERKGRKDKVKKLLEKLSLLMGGQNQPALLNSNESNDETGVDGNDDGNQVDSESVQEFRRCENSVVLMIEPKSTKTVNAYLRCSSVKKENTSMQRLLGTLYVNEFKNNDVVKKIYFQALCCFDNESFIQTQIEYSKNATEHNSSVPSTPKIPHADVFWKPILTSIPSSPTFSQVLETEPRRLDVGKVPIHIASEHYFKIHNCTDDPIHYQISHKHVPDVYLLSPFSGVLAGNGIVRIDFVVKALSCGKRSAEFWVNDVTSGSRSYFTVFYHAIEAEYLRFPDLGADALIDFGDCYFDPSSPFSKCRSLQVLNISKYGLFVSARSNLTQQVFVYANEELSILAQDIYLPAKESINLFICLQPTSIGENQSKEMRNLVGGIKITVKIPQEKLEDYDIHTIKFTARIGQSQSSLVRDS